MNLINKLAIFILTQIIIALFAFSLAHSPVEAPPARYTGPVEVVQAEARIVQINLPGGYVRFMEV